MAKLIPKKFNVSDEVYDLLKEGKPHVIRSTTHIVGQELDVVSPSNTEPLECCLTQNCPYAIGKNRYDRKNIC